MRKIENQGCSYWQFNLLSNHPEIVHGSFTRYGGYSQGNFASLNTSYEVGDDPKAVTANQTKLRSLFGLQHLLSGKQHHSDIVQVIETVHDPILPCDALVTALPNVGLLIKHADCQAALFYDPIKRVIAGAHAGWKGSVQKIFTKTIQTMQARFGTDPKDLLVAISPSLGPDSAEFIHYQKELPQSFWGYQVKPTYFDFWAISKDELQAAGVLPHHIEIASLCTKNDVDSFSYRREKTTGRLASVISII